MYMFKSTDFIQWTWLFKTSCKRINEVIFHLVANALSILLHAIKKAMTSFCVTSKGNWKSNFKSVLGNQPYWQSFTFKISILNYVSYTSMWHTARGYKWANRHWGQKAFMDSLINSRKYIKIPHKHSPKVSSGYKDLKYW